MACLRLKSSKVVSVVVVVAVVVVVCQKTINILSLLANIDRSKIRNNLFRLVSHFFFLSTIFPDPRDEFFCRLELADMRLPLSLSISILISITIDLA